MTIRNQLLRARFLDGVATTRSALAVYGDARVGTFPVADDNPAHVEFSQYQVIGALAEFVADIELADLLPRLREVVSNHVTHSPGSAGADSMAAALAVLESAAHGRTDDQNFMRRAVTVSHLAAGAVGLAVIATIEIAQIAGITPEEALDHLDMVVAA